ncbi:MAG: DUF542 domain-containing protein, partial [Polyangia bacterium]|nr:DUF542 domain-containing protein [Polyangia bacterium]
MMNADQTLGELVVENPAAARIFQRHGLDYCCAGKRTLLEACEAERVDAEVVLGELEAARAEPRDLVRWSERPLEELVGHILDRYHGPLGPEIERLVALARQVERVHAGKPELPEGLADLLEEVLDAVRSHLDKEEKILFPLILGGRGQLAHMPVQ